MNNLKLRNIFVGLAVAFSIIMAFFSTDSFLEFRHFSVSGNSKQQYYNNVGPFEISPFKAAKFYYYQSNICHWIDIRPTAAYKTDHLPFTKNMDFLSLKKSAWEPAQILLIMGNDDGRVQQTVAMLRQVKNIRAFAVMGGYTHIKNWLIDPIGFDLLVKLSNEQLANLQLYREKLSGRQAASINTQKNINVTPAEPTEDEGC